MLSYCGIDYAARRTRLDYLIGLALAAAVGLLATFVGFDRDRAFYPTVMIVIASYYVLFAISGGTTETLIIESAVMLLFAGAAIAGFKRSLWIVVAALAAHGIFDWLRAPMISNPGVPPWWPQFCLAYDVVAAAYLAIRLTRKPSTLAA
jgi:hypothetical protein